MQHKLGGLSNGFDDQPMAPEKHLMPEKPDPRLTKYRLDQRDLIRRDPV